MENEHKVGYRNPPRNTRFQKGVCPNPNGRPRSTELPAQRIFNKILQEKVSFKEGGEYKTASWAELVVKSLVTSAVGGDISAAAQLLKLHAHAQRNDEGPLTINVTGGLPDKAENAAAATEHDDADCNLAPESLR